MKVIRKPKIVRGDDLQKELNDTNSGPIQQAPNVKNDTGGGPAPLGIPSQGGQAYNPKGGNRSLVKKTKKAVDESLQPVNSALNVQPVQNLTPSGYDDKEPHQLELDKAVEVAQEGLDDDLKDEMNAGGINGILDDVQTSSKEVDEIVRRSEEDEKKIVRQARQKLAQMILDGTFTSNSFVQAQMPGPGNLGKIETPSDTYASSSNTNLETGPVSNPNESKNPNISIPRPPEAPPAKPKFEEPSRSKRETAKEEYVNGDANPFTWIFGGGAPVRRRNEL